MIGNEDLAFSVEGNCTRDGAGAHTFFAEWRSGHAPLTHAIRAQRRMIATSLRDERGAPERGKLIGRKREKRAFAAG